MSSVKIFQQGYKVYKKNELPLDISYVLDLSHYYEFDEFRQNDITNINELCKNGGGNGKLKTIIISDKKEFGVIDTIIINNNIRIKSYDFLRFFPKLKHLVISNMFNFTNDDMKNISKHCRFIETVNIYLCPNLNIRIFISLYEMKYLKKIWIDDPRFYCQYDINKLFISDEEWRNMISETITDIVINSENMNSDIIDYIFKSSPYLNSISLAKSVYETCMKQIVSGSSRQIHDRPEYVLFYIWEDIIRTNPKLPVAIKWRPTFTKMIKNMSMFSKEPTFEQ